MKIIHPPGPHFPKRLRVRHRDVVLQPPRFDRQDVLPQAVEALCQGTQGRGAAAPGPGMGFGYQRYLVFLMIF